jgi:hypothetical protein
MDINLEVSLSERAKLREQIKQGDYAAAARIYVKKNGLNITANYISRFFRGDRNGSVKIQRRHQPLAMYRAMVQAIETRNANAQTANAQAAELRRQLIEKIQRDTRSSPITL